MQYLGLALYAEGPTDYRFLCPLLQRLCEEICAQASAQPVEIGEVLRLNHPDTKKDAPREQRIVAVIPVRETEAWALCDGEALRRVFGVTLSDGQLGLPSALHMVECAADPKAMLESAFNSTGPSGRRRKQSVAPMLNALGEQVSLQHLRRLKAFALLDTELREALRQLRIIRPEGG